MGKNLTFLGDLEDRNKVSIFAPSISCGWRNKMPFFKVLHTYRINRCPQVLDRNQGLGIFCIWGLTFSGYTGRHFGRCLKPSTRLHKAVHGNVQGVR